MTHDDQGVAQCGIEQAYLAGKTDFRKPVSCHLYPIRIKEYPTHTAVNYDHWDICSAACTLGKSLKVPVFQFVREALIRKFGEEFFHLLEESAKIHEKKPDHP